MDTRAKITSKGQVTIPKSVRDALQLHEGDELLFRVERSRAVIAKTPDLLALAGSVAVPTHKRGTAWDEIVRRTRRERVRAATLTAFVDTNVLIRHLTGDPPRWRHARLLRWPTKRNSCSRISCSRSACTCSSPSTRSSARESPS